MYTCSEAGGGGVKNEAMEETVDAAWLQTELNRQEKLQPETMMNR
jgi:hypothetical protein